MRSLVCLLVAWGLAGAAEVDGVAYLGRPRSEQWVDAVYAEFREKVGQVDGVWVDTGGENRWADALGLGDVAMVHGQVVRVLDGRFLVRLYKAGHDETIPPSLAASDGQVLLITGQAPPSNDYQRKVVGLRAAELEGKRLLECQEAPRRLEGVTREQFLEALASGFRLGVWSLQEKPMPARDGVERKQKRWVKRWIK